ncbi:uncharacterized protein LOC144869931 [Branchiostoma floridae x Branchiostoma japonicum]
MATRLLGYRFHATCTICLTLRIKALTEGEFRRPVQNRPLLRVYLDNNPIHCDATVLWLANISLHERSCRCFKECYGDVMCMQQCQENCTVNALNIHFHSDYSSRITCASPEYMRGKLIHEMLTTENMPSTDDTTETRAIITTNVAVFHAFTKATAPNGDIRYILPKHNHQGRSQLIIHIVVSVAMAIVAIVLLLLICKYRKAKLVQRRRRAEARGRQLTCSRNHAYETARNVVTENVEEEQDRDQTTPYGIAKQNPIYVTADEQDGEEP